MLHFVFLVTDRKKTCEWILLTFYQKITIHYTFWKTWNSCTFIYKCPLLHEALVSQWIQMVGFSSSSTTRANEWPNPCFLPLWILPHTWSVSTCTVWFGNKSSPSYMHGTTAQTQSFDLWCGKIKIQNDRPFFNRGVGTIYLSPPTSSLPLLPQKFQFANGWPFFVGHSTFPCKLSNSIFLAYYLPCSEQHFGPFCCFLPYQDNHCIPTPSLG